MESIWRLNSLEAIAAKSPIISTNVLGTKETVAKVFKVLGKILIPVGSVEALAAAIKQMITVLK
jgi:glycosyltransferase involved in cell wall biosynthesis